MNTSRYKISFIIIISLFLLTAIVSCKKEEVDAPPSNPVGKIEKFSVVNLDITEPSGLSFGPDGNTLLIVSDNTNKAYETTLQGDIIRELAYVGNDLEGIVYNADAGIVAIAEERKKEIVFLDYENGNELERFQINTGGSTQNKGLEGISYNPNNSAYYIVNEDLPGELIVWNKQFDIISKKELHFAGDYSAIFVDTQNSLLWIVSDESKALFQCDYNAKVLKEYSLPKDKFEGIAVDAENKLIYLVNDTTAELYIYKIIEK
jgi:uncharacterized protein YjiK